MLPYTTGNIQPLSEAEAKDLRQICADYENWGVPLSGAIESSLDVSNYKRQFAVIVRGQIVIALQDTCAIYVAPEGLNADGVKKLFADKAFRFGEDVARKHLTRFRVTREIDRGPWMDLLRSWMLDMRRELDKGREEQRERLALSFGGGLL